MRRSLFPLCVALALGGVAQAQDGNAERKGDPDFPAKLFAGPAGKDKNYACFVRVYDPGHLARHPLQKVKAMKLLVTGEPAEDSPGLSYSFRMGVAFVKRPGNFDSSGACSHRATDPDDKSDDRNAQLGCGVDCDGGGISIELKPDNKATLVRLERIRIWRNNNPEEEGLDLSGGADDKVFRLDRASLSQCRSLITDRKELAAIRSPANKKQ
jgi:hypothetical protein